MTKGADRSDHIIAAWCAELERLGTSPHTRAAYRRGLEHFIAWNQQTYGVEFELDRVMPRDVRDWKAHQQTRERAAPGTINQRLAALSRFYRWAIRQGLAGEDPGREVKGVRPPERRPKALDERDLRLLLREARGDARDYALLEMMVGTGLRVGELLALQVGDVVVGERSGRVIVRRGKGEGYREVPLTVDVRHAVEAYLREHPERDNPDAGLWVGQSGPLRHRSSVLRILEKYAIRAGLDAIHPHALRHTFATRYLRANPGDLRGLARLLGHGSLNTVMVYTEPDMDDLAERMERVETGG